MDNVQINKIQKHLKFDSDGELDDCAVLDAMVNVTLLKMMLFKILFGQT
jgi:hypothetical protein